MLKAAAPPRARLRSLKAPTDIYPNFTRLLKTVDRYYRSVVQRILILFYNVAIILLLGLVGCQHLPTQPGDVSPTAIHGITLVDWSPTGYSRAAADSALSAIAAVGATHVAIIVTAYQSNQSANQIQIDKARTPTFGSVSIALTRAVSLGLKVVVKPHVDLDDGTWRGHINPSDPAAWFESYKQFVGPFVSLAESVGAVQFVVGTELAGTIKHTDLWNETIRFVRSRFSSEIVYAASWDEASKVSFWQSVDLVGVDFYFPVTVRPDPGRFEILSGWQPWLERLHLLHNQTGRKIVLTEIGYASIDGAGMQPYAYGGNRVIDLAEQADLYWAALQATSNLDWIAGMYWWNWSADGSGGPRNSDYTPAGKPAQLELSRSWRR